MEEMYNRLRAGQPPAQAVQHAASWLRRLTRAEVVEKVETELARATARRRELAKQRQTMSIDQRRTDDTYHEITRMIAALSDSREVISSGSEMPFSHPFHWAPFAVHGNSAPSIMPPRGLLGLVVARVRSMFIVSQGS